MSLLRGKTVTSLKFQISHCRIRASVASTIWNSVGLRCLYSSPTLYYGVGTKVSFAVNQCRVTANVELWGQEPLLSGDWVIRRLPNAVIVLLARQMRLRWMGDRRERRSPQYHIYIELREDGGRIKQQCCKDEVHSSSHKSCVSETKYKNINLKRNEP